MTALFPAIDAGTTEERIALAVEAYSLDHLRPRTVQEIEAARRLAHDEEYGAFRDLALELWATDPKTAVDQILRWLPAFADQWARTERAYFAAMTDALDRIEREQQ